MWPAVRKERNRITLCNIRLQTRKTCWKYDTAEYFWRTSRCLRMWSKFALCVWYISSVEAKPKAKTEEEEVKFTFVSCSTSRSYLIWVIWCSSIYSTYHPPDSMQSVLTYSCAVHLIPVSLCVISRNFIVSSGSCSLVIISLLHSSKCMS